MVFMDRICDFDVVIGFLYFVDGKSRLDFNWKGDMVEVLEEEERFENFRVFGLDNWEFEIELFDNRNAGATRKTDVELGLAVRYESVGGEDFVGKVAVEGRSPQWGGDVVLKRAFDANPHGWSAAVRKSEGYGVGVAVEDVNEMGFLRLELDLLRGCGFGHEGVGKRVKPTIRACDLQRRYVRRLERRRGRSERWRMLQRRSGGGLLGGLAI